MPIWFAKTSYAGSEGLAHDVIRDELGEPVYRQVVDEEIEPGRPNMVKRHSLAQEGEWGSSSCTMSAAVLTSCSYLMTLDGRGRSAYSPDATPLAIP